MQQAIRVLGRVAMIVACAAGVGCRDNSSARSANEPAARTVTPDNSVRESNYGAMNPTTNTVPTSGPVAGANAPNNNTGPWNNGGATSAMGNGGVIGQTNEGTPAARGGGPARMNDGDIAQITTVVNQGEIQQAQLARARARNPEVRQFAEHMIQQHQQMLQSQSQLLGRVGISPTPNDTSHRLDLEGQSTMQSLQSLTGDDFDRQYIDAQVRQHQQVLQSLDSQLIPSAQNAQFRQALTEARSMVQQHLDEARRIQQGGGGAVGGGAMHMH